MFADIIAQFIENDTTKVGMVSIRIHNLFTSNILIEKKKEEYLLKKYVS